MAFIKNGPGIIEKLEILSQDAQYDLACACATGPDEHRQRSREDKWIYPVTLSQGGSTYLFKTLLSNKCINDCRYCPLRANANARRCNLSPEELSKIFLSYYQARKVSGLFLSSAVTADPDGTMEQINRTALLLRKLQFKGYIHLKIIPGASDAAIRQSLALASAVSLNIETAGEHNFKQLSTTKNYARDILRPIRLISRLIRENHYLRRLKHTTQFVVGASSETDREIINTSWQLYKKLQLNRIYFSAYQRGAGSSELAGEHSNCSNADLLLREHRLYQTDWLIRKYGFKADEIPFDAAGNISLECDPKEMWAKLHPEFFPVNVNKDDKERLLRVPGLGLILVEKILTLRKNKIKIRSLGSLSKQRKLLEKAQNYLTY